MVSRTYYSYGNKTTNGLKSNNIITLRVVLSSNTTATNSNTWVRIGGLICGTHRNIWIDNSDQSAAILAITTRKIFLIRERTLQGADANSKEYCQIAGPFGAMSNAGNSGA
jgi:hypothetical protein